MGPKLAKPEVSSPHWLVASSAQHAPTWISTIGMTRPEHDLLPHGTALGAVAIPALPARPTVPLPLLPKPEWAPLPAPPAEVSCGSEALPPQAAAPSTANTPKTQARRTLGQDIEASISRASARCEPFRRRHMRRREHWLRVGRAAKRAPLALGFLQARAFLRTRPRSWPPSRCTTSSHNSGLFISAPNNGGCKWPAAANQR